MTAESHQPAQSRPAPPGQQRRGFLTVCLALLAGALVALFPLAVGLFAFLDPLRSKRSSAQGAGDTGLEGYYKVARLDTLPGDGTPQYVKVLADRNDAWTYFHDEPIGAVYLRRVGEEVIAFNVACPHAGCAVDFDRRADTFQCPCHNSSFSLEGQRSANSPSPRNLDTLQVKIEAGVVWVHFENFRTGMAEKVPIA